MRLSEVTVGMGVVYRPYPGAQAEDGEVVRIGTGGMVFVLFAGDRTAKATRAVDLEPVTG